MKSTLLRVALVLFTLTAAAQPAPSKDLKIFFIDVEGGQATLFVAPSGKSLLIDTGWPGNSGRDADRIAAAAHQAGLARIDCVLITHYHVDHVGGLPQLLARIPVGTFLDHGPNTEPNDQSTQSGYAAYQALLATGKYQHLTLHPADTLPVQGFNLDGLSATVISSNGEVLAQPLPGAGQPNAFCAASQVRPPDTSENGRSFGILITFGKLRILDLGDLTWDREMNLMCPANRLGHIDIDIVSHHGLYQSSSPALVYAIAPRVAIMDNGAKKGGSTVTLKTFHASPGLEALWQLHYSEEGGQENNTPDQYIANPHGPDAGLPLELTAHLNGSFQVTNPRTHQTEIYPAR